MSGSIIIGTELDTKEFDAQIEYVQNRMEEIEKQLKDADMGFEVGDTQKLEVEYERLGNQLIDLKNKQEKYNRAIEESTRIDFKKINNQLNDIGKTMKSNIKKVTRWALAIFGVRSAYMFVRSAMSTIAGDDKQLKADLDYMKNAIAYSIEPLVRGIVNLAKQLLQYIAYIIKAWTGKNIFENANKSLEKTNKQAKELNKTLAGFDEMNVVGNKTDTNNVKPSFDLTTPEDIDAPKWLKWIGKNGKLVVSILAGIAAAIVAIKLGLGGIKALGIGILVEGILYTIQSIIDYLKDPTWENFGQVLTGIAIILAGLAVIFSSIPLAIAAAIVAILAIIGSFWDKIKKFLDGLVKNIYKVGDNIKKWLHENLGIIGEMIGIFIDATIEVITRAIKFITNIFHGLFTGIKDVLDGIINLFKGNFKEGLIKIVKGIGNALIGILNALIDAVNVIIFPLRAIIVGFGKITGKNWTFEDISIPNIPYLAKGGIVNNPGPGVMMGSYVAGEGGPEAVIPLDDNTLDRLGLAFAKHTSINATIINEMNGRVISRELQKINAEDNFAYNG